MHHGPISIRRGWRVGKGYASGLVHARVGSLVPVASRPSSPWSRLVAAGAAAALGLLVALPSSRAQPRAAPAPALSASGSSRAPSGAAPGSALAVSSGGAGPAGGPAAGGPAGATSSRPFVLGAAASARPSPGFAPDPEPLVTSRKWVYEIIYHEGAIFSPTPAARVLPRPTETPRKMGRFALELYVGRTLLDRVRFDLPLLNGDPFTGDPHRPYNAPPDFERKARVRALVEVPDSERATYAILVDRATGRRVRLFWPPVDAPIKPGPARQ